MRRVSKGDFIYKSDESIRLSDGRNFGFAEMGISNGIPVFLLLGQATNRYLHHPSLKLTAALGIRLIIPERSGIGLSSFHAKQNFLSFADDILQLVRSLKLERLSVIGFEAGIPYALACAQRMPENIANLSLIGETSPAYLSYLRDLDAESAESEWHSLQDFIALLHPSDQAFMQYGQFYLMLKRNWTAMLSAIKEHESRDWESAKAALLLREQELLAGDWGIDFNALKTPAVLYRFEREIASPPDWHSILLAKDFVRATNMPNTGSFTFLFSWWARLLVSISSYQRKEWEVKNRTTLLGADLSGEALQGLDLWSWALRNTDFSGADIRATLFAGADLSGADFSSAIGHRADFAGADLWYTKFNFADMQEAVFQGANVRDAYFVRADLRNADFQEAALTQSDLSYANLYRADFNGANLYQAKLKGAELDISPYLSMADSASFDARTVMPDAVFNEATGSYSHYYQRETDMSRFTNPEASDFREPED